jgi:hypothetical protein
MAGYGVRHTSADPAQQAFHKKARYTSAGSAQQAFLKKYQKHTKPSNSAIQASNGCPISPIRPYSQRPRAHDAQCPAIAVLCPAVGVPSSHPVPP